MITGELANPHVGRLALTALATSFCQMILPSAASKQISNPSLLSVYTLSPSIVGVALVPPS